MDRIRQGTLQMVVAMTVLGSIGWFVVMSGRAVTDVVFWRCVFAAPVLLAVCAAGGWLRPMPLRTFALAALGGAAIVVNWLLLFAAFPLASISVATVVYNTQPFMLLALGALCFGERITLRKLAWLATAFAGVLLVVQARPGTGAPAAGFVSGILLALGAALFYAIATIVAKKLDGTPPQQVTLVQVCVGALLLAPFADFAAPPSDARTWATLLALGAIHTGLVYILLYGAIQKLPTHLTGSLSFLYPVAAIVVDVLAFDHRLQPAQVGGAALILLAAASMNLGWSLPRTLRWSRSPRRRCASRHAGTRSGVECPGRTGGAA